NRAVIVALSTKPREFPSTPSGPTSAPSLLLALERSRNYNKLHYDTISRPTWDRSILAKQSPGSPFKILNALAALQEGVITPETRIRCYNGFYVGNTLRGGHYGGGDGDLITGIYLSCN